MGANKSKINKAVLQELVTRTKRSPAEIKAIYAIFLRNFPNGKIESPQDLLRCLKKFSLVPAGNTDPTVAERLYRLFDAQNRGIRVSEGIGFFHFMVVSNILEYGPTHDKMTLYFESFDVNNDGVITRDDLEQCLPPTVESQQLIQQLIRQWDMNRDGVVSKDDFRQYITTNPDLLSMFADAKDRVRLDSITVAPPNDTNPSAHYVNVNRTNLFTVK